MATTVPLWKPLSVLHIPGPNNPRCQAVPTSQGGSECKIRLERARYAQARTQISRALNENVTPFAIPESSLRQDLQSAAKLLLCPGHRSDQDAISLANRWVKKIVDWDCQGVIVDDYCPLDLDSLEEGQRVVKCGQCPKYIHADCIIVWLKQNGLCPYW